MSRFMNPHATQRQQRPRINALPRNVVYDPNTGRGTGQAARRMGVMNRDGSASPTTALGSPTGPLSQPGRTMMNPSGGGISEREKNVRAAMEDGTFGAKQLKFNQANPGLHMHDNGKITEHPDSEKRLAEAAAKNPAQDGQPSRSMNPSTAGQADSMRAAMAPPPGTDRWGRTSASPSAGGRPVVPTSSPAPAASAPQTGGSSGVAGVHNINSGYGTGSSFMRTSGNTANTPSPKPTAPAMTPGEISKALGSAPIPERPTGSPALPSSLPPSRLDSPYLPKQEAQQPPDTRSQAEKNANDPGLKDMLQKVADYKDQQQSRKMESLVPKPVPAPAWSPPKMQVGLADVPQKPSTSTAPDLNIAKNISGGPGRVTELNGRPYKSPLIADMKAAENPAPKPAGTPLSMVKPFAQVSPPPSSVAQPLNLPVSKPKPDDTADNGDGEDGEDGDGADPENQPDDEEEKKELADE